MSSHSSEIYAALTLNVIKSIKIMMRAILSYFKALKASGLYGSAIKNDKKGSKIKAFDKAIKGLEILSHPIVIRKNPAESSVLINLTIFIEEMAEELNKNGANEIDLIDTYLLIKELENTDVFCEYSSWLKYIELKLGYVPHE